MVEYLVLDISLEKPIKMLGFAPGAGSNPLSDSCSVFAGPLALVLYQLISIKFH